MDNTNVQDFVRDMEEDILDDDQLDGMIMDDNELNTEDILPPPKPVQQPKKLQKKYQEQFKQPKRKVEQYDQPIQGTIQNIPYIAPSKNKGMSLNSLKSMMNPNTLKLPILVAVLFIVLSVPQLNDLLGKYINLFKPDETGKQSYLSLMIKGVFLGLVVLVMNKLFNL